MHDTWAIFLSAAEHQINPQHFDRWFRQIRPVRLEGSLLVLSVPDRFFLEFFRDQYLDFLKKEISALLGRPIQIEFLVGDAANEPAIEEASPVPQTVGSRQLNTRYTFDSFVVGTSNQLSHAAAQSVSDNPGGSFNPLFIMGGVGVGKTHLLNAIGHAILRKNPGTKVLYLHSGEFLAEVIGAVHGGQLIVDEFRSKYREHCGVLLMDDIQFIAGKDRTQEEFFHIFNALYDRKAQIVVTSDKLPQQILSLEERLVSRFAWGMIADIQPPDMETRVAILMKKALLDGITLPDDVAIFVASNISSNVRELEGSLNRLSAFSSLQGKPLSIDLARLALKDILLSRGDTVNIDHIQRIVSNYFGVHVKDLKSERRSRMYSNPRQLAMFLCRKHGKHSFPDIGREFGGKDHSTVIAACNKIERLLKTDSKLRNTINDIEKSL